MAMVFDYINNTPATDLQITQLLLQEIDRYSESTVYGTEYTRALIVRQHGDNATLPKRMAEQPLLIEFIRNTDANTNAIGKDPRKSDSFPQTRIDRTGNISNDLRLPGTADARVIVSRSASSNGNFFVTTNSVSENGQGAQRFSDVVYVCCMQQAIISSWVTHVGDTRLSQAQFAKSIEQHIRKQISDRVVGLQIKEIKTTFDSAVSWVTEVNYFVVGDRRNLLGSIIAHRT